MNTKSLLTLDIQTSVERAYDVDLSGRERVSVHRHLAFALGQLKEPNALREPVTLALARLDSEFALDVQRSLRWAAWASAGAAGAAFFAAVASVVVALHH